MSNYRRNYTGGGIYFFTVVLANRHGELLLRHIEDFRAAYGEAQRHHPFETVAICVLPDHFHLLMGLPEGDCDYSLRLSAIKHNFSRRLPADVKKPNVSQSGKREAGIWQLRFWEHLIRDEDDLQRHMDYIYYNPVKHGYASAVKDWPLSSFRRDVGKGLYALDWGADTPSLNQMNDE